MWVVKLGGSLQDTEYLPAWLEVLDEASAGNIILVAGGGKYADEIRRRQIQEDFDDASAHRQALQATEMYAKDMQKICPSLKLLKHTDDIISALAAGLLPVWLPADTLDGRTDIPASWDFTSDSIAAWLALRLECEALFLVKSMPLERSSNGPGELSQKGFVDACLEGLVADSGLPVFWLDKKLYRQFSTETLPTDHKLIPRII